MHIKMNRRGFIKSGAIVITGLAILPSWRSSYKKLRFGWLTDLHYAEAPVKWGRYYTESRDKLREAIDLFNGEAVDFIIETGDFKDQTEPPVESETKEYLSAIEKEFSKFNGARYHVLGNHDLDSLSKRQFLRRVENTGIRKNKSYYWYENTGFRFVVLDACFKSDGTDYDHDNFHWTDTNIAAKQIKWLKDVLKDSHKPVVVFVHQLLDGEGDLYVNNAKEVRDVLETYGNVVAVFQGHDHKGGAKVVNGILYYTLKALVEGSGMANNSYAIVHLNTDGEVIIEGYRKADDYEYNSHKQEFAEL